MSFDQSPSGYSVGYRKPPTEHRFRPGQSANPQGKQKGKRNLLNAFKRRALKKVRVRVRGKTRTMTRAEAVVFKYWQHALEGDKNALFNLVPLVDESGSIIERTVADRAAELNKTIDWNKPSWREFAWLLQERKRLQAKLARRKSIRAKARRLSRQGKDPLA